MQTNYLLDLDLRVARIRSGLKLADVVRIYNELQPPRKITEGLLSQVETNLVRPGDEMAARLAQIYSCNSRGQP